MRTRRLDVISHPTKRTSSASNGLSVEVRGVAKIWVLGPGPHPLNNEYR